MIIYNHKKKMATSMADPGPNASTEDVMRMLPDGFNDLSDLISAVWVDRMLWRHNIDFYGGITRNARPQTLTSEQYDFRSRSGVKCTKGWRWIE